MFKDLHVFEYTNFPFKTKCNNTVVYSVNSNYFTEGVLFHRGIRTGGALTHRYTGIFVSEIVDSLHIDSISHAYLLCNTS